MHDTALSRECTGENVPVCTYTEKEISGLRGAGQACDEVMNDLVRTEKNRFVRTAPQGRQYVPNVSYSATTFLS
jgi:hypothetical protein